MIDYKALADMLIDNTCELESPEYVVHLLISYGLTEHQIVETLMFDKSTYDEVAKDIKEELAKQEGEGN
jgi:hypothetical protein